MRKTITNIIKKINFNRVIRTAIGSSASFAMCSFIGLKYAPSAAVITLLCIQDTKRETAVDIIKRIPSYITAILLSYLLFTNLGFNFGVFALFMLIMVSINYVFGWNNTLSSSTVVTTHFLIEGSFEHGFLIDEIELLIVGTAIAACMNVFIPGNDKKIKADIVFIERELSALITHLSLTVADKLTVEEIQKQGDGIPELTEHLHRSRSKALKYMNNTLNPDSEYYLEYIELREAQLHTLVRIHEDLLGVSASSLPLKDEVAEVLDLIGANLASKRGFIESGEALKTAKKKYPLLPMPKTMAELEDIAILRDVLNELEYFLDMKKNFIASLSAKQLDKYYEDEK